MEDGRKYPICAIGAEDFLGHGHGVSEPEGSVPPPGSSTTPGFIWITTGEFKIRMAPYIPPGSSGGA